jgi:hypothetical protein
MLDEIISKTPANLQDSDLNLHRDWITSIAKETQSLKKVLEFDFMSELETLHKQ